MPNHSELVAAGNTAAGSELATADANELDVAHSPRKARFKKSAADMEQMVEHYPAGVREDTVWTQGFLREHCNGNLELLRAVAEKIGFKRSQAFFYNALNGHAYSPGKGKGDVAFWRELVGRLREHDRTATAAGKLGFILTPTYRCIENFIHERRLADAACKFGIITGPTGSQKSACRKYYRSLYNHGRTVGFEAPSRQSLPAFERKLAEQYDASVGNSAPARQASIRKNVRNDKTIMIDNAQRLFIHTAGNKQPIFDYVMELQEDTDCTIILWVCEDFVANDLEQQAAKAYFEQLVGRFGGMSDILRLPKHTPASDLRTIARAYDLHDGAGAMEYLTRWSREPGRIRILFSRLARARQFSTLDGRDRVTLADLAEADTYIPPSVGEDEGGAE